jgi:hypothetical protein
MADSIFPRIAFGVPEISRAEASLHFAKKRRARRGEARRQMGVGHGSVLRVVPQFAAGRLVPPTR